MPLGATTSAPDVGLGHGELGVEQQGGVVVHLAGASSTTPQWPWSVNSSRQQSAITTIESPTASRTAARARWVMPSGRSAAEPVGSLSSGRGSPNRMTPGTPSAPRRLTSTVSESHRVLHHAGQRGDGARFGEAVGHEQRGHQVVDAQVASRRPAGAWPHCPGDGACGWPGTRARPGRGPLAEESLVTADQPTAGRSPRRRWMRLRPTPRPRPPPTRRWCAGWPRRPPAGRPPGPCPW